MENNLARHNFLSGIDRIIKQPGLKNLKLNRKVSRTGGKSNLAIFWGETYSRPQAMKAIRSQRNLKEAAYQRLKESIVRGEVPPGSKMVETHLAHELGISRTPLREAVNRLEQDGFVEILPRRGAFVKKHSLQEILENLELREVLEGLAVRLAAHSVNLKVMQEIKSCFLGFTHRNVESSIDSYANQNVRFHNLIIQASQNRKLITMIRNLYDQMDMVRLRTIVLPGRAKKSLTEHRKIIYFIKRRRGDLAEKYLRAHIRGLRKAILKLEASKVILRNTRRSMLG